MPRLMKFRASLFGEQGYIAFKMLLAAIRDYEESIHFTSAFYKLNC